MLIKASAITNLTDARYFAAKEVAFLGFNLEENTEGYLDPMHMKAIREWVEGPQVVGEFTRASASYVREAAAFFGLDAVQAPATTLDADAAALEGLTVIASVDGSLPELDTILEEKAPYVAYFLVDMSREIDSSTGLVVDPETWKQRCARFPILIRADVVAEHWPRLLAAIQPAGIDLAGGEEERVGVKSFDEIEAIFDALEEMSE
ncbi:MAG: hypothetical protein JNM22_06615 [Saprospiraceae bacterium]|nr:hypothetical protein [Saprospiraceae bacterium]